MSEFVDNYLKWLKDSIIEKETGDCTEITTPFLDRHNDWIQIYIERKNGELYLTDDGYTIDDLAMSGCDMTTPYRKELVKKIVNGYGVRISEKNELYVLAKKDDFPQKKHALIQCMLAVNDLYVTSRSSVASMFSDDIKSFLTDNSIIFASDICFIGKTGLNHKFDFIVPQIRDMKETLIKSINNPTKDSVLLTLFQWEDTRSERPKESQLMMYLNDSKKIPSSIIESCNNYNVIPILWKKRKESLKYLPHAA